MNEVFYVIRVINKAGTRGFVYDTKEGIQVATKIDGNVTQFQTFEEARDFIKAHKLDGKKSRAYVVDSEALMDEKLFTSINEMEPLFFIEREDGKKLMYEPKEQIYFFRDAEVGFVCWKDDANLKNMLKLLAEQKHKVSAIPMSSLKK